MGYVPINLKAKMTVFGNFVNGNWITENELIEIKNPATGLTIAHVARGTKKTISLAVNAGAAAFKSGWWSRKEVSDRFRIMIEISRKLTG